MATLREKLDAAIAVQQREVERLATVAKDDLAAARTRLRLLKDAIEQLDLNPAAEAGYATLKALGVALDTE